MTDTNHFDRQRNSGRLPAIVCGEHDGEAGCTAVVAEGETCVACRNTQRLRARQERRR